MFSKVFIFFLAVLNAALADGGSSICSSCKCDSKILNCQSLNIYELFSTEEWIALDFEIDIIRLDHNFITNVTIFPEIKLRILDLSHNQITWIEKRAFRNLTSIEVLDLSYNRLKSEALTPNVFEGHFNAETYLSLKTLKELRLGNNDLHVLDPDLFEHLPALEKLSLDSNPFKVIDHNTEMAISGINTLKFLDLSYMELNTLPLHLFHSPRALNCLNLTGNLFDQIPEALQFAVNLQFLNLDENPFADMVGKNKFMTMPKLKVLSLSYMGTLTKIDSGSFNGLTSLEEIYINNNRHLSQIHQSAFRLLDDNSSSTAYPPLKILDIHNNNLSQIESKLLENWDDLQVIDIRANPLRCDCENQWLFDYLLPRIEKITPNITDTMVCAYPSVGITLKDYKTHHMRCVESHSELDNLTIGLLVGILIGIPLSLGTLMIYKRGCFGFLNRRGPADYSRAFYKQTGTDDMHF